MFVMNTCLSTTMTKHRFFLFWPRDTSLLDKSNSETRLPVSEMLHMTLWIKGLKKIPESWKSNYSLKWDASTVGLSICHYTTNMQEGRKRNRPGKFEVKTWQRTSSRSEGSTAHRTLTALPSPSPASCPPSAVKPSDTESLRLIFFFFPLLIFRQCK